MRQRRFIWILLCLLCGAGVWFLWNHAGRSPAPQRTVAPTPVATRSLSTAVQAPGQGKVNTNVAQISLAEWNTNKFAGRLSNTTKTIGQLVNDGQAILLANALIDTREPLNFVFPKNLQPQGDPGAYIVQARGPIDNAFRAMLAGMGATIVSYIPNDAYLVRADAGVAGMLGANSLVQAVIPYEPYYKIQSSLLYPAVSQLQMPDDMALNLGLFADDAPATIQQIKKLGGQVMGQDRSPFGPIVRVIPPRNWTTLATLSGVQIVEPSHARSLANDLSRATVGVAADSLTATNYLNLTGTNVIVEVNDTGIDAQHPDLTTARVFGDAPQSLTDTAGHGTHVAGIIAGSGLKSPTVTNAPGSTLVGGVGSPGQFRGMAPGATLYSVGGIAGGLDPNLITDQYFQEVPARTNALISNNSWVFEGDSAYDLFAASYDAAVRDALPEVTGSQPVLFVFAAGNAGNGQDDSDFGGGIADSIESPATAKNVITVGAIQEDRNITATVTNADGTSGQPWQAETSTGYRVAGFSSRGNVGIGIEGTFGRYKPDVCAPGTFTLSTRSEQWDINSYFYQNPTNDQSKYFSGFTVQPGSIVSRPFPFVPSNAVELQIWTFPNANSPGGFAVMPTLIGLFSTPGYQYLSTSDPVTIPPGPPTLQQILGTEGFLGGFNFAISNNTANRIVFDLQTDIITTNGSGTYFLVLSNLDQSIGTLNGSSTGPGPFYRFETGTSMSAADVSGTLALMQQFYAGAYGVLPSPAMLKAMLINGARATGFYNYGAQNSINYEGWGLINLPDSLPPGITNQLNQSCSTFIQDQNPTNALATGDSQTFIVLTTNALPLHVTLAWTDPPGDPAAAIKLVNNLVLVVTNTSNPTNPIVYYGNDFPASSTVNSPHATNTPPVIDSINNVQNVNLQLSAGTNFSVTVMGYRVNVNAVTAQTNNVVQDYALVISAGNGQVPGVMKVTSTPAPTVSNPTGDQQITNLAPSAVGFMTSFQMLLNQFVGANTPLLGNNTVVFSTTAPEGFGPNNWQVTVGMTNQWHFYVVTNTSLYSNAAFVTFNPNAPEPDTLSIPREGVFGGSIANASRDADIDLYVTTDPSITNLNPAAISNCVVGTQVGATAGPTFAGASLGRGTTEFVVDTNSQSRTPSVYYIGVKSEDQMSAEYGFITIFSAAPFSTMQNGVQTVYGVPVPMNIPDGSPTVPGKGYVFGLAIYPETAGTVTVSNNITHQNFGDLIGTLTLNGGHADVLNNHDSFGNPPGPYDLLYDDSAGGGLLGSRPSDGPGTLTGYMGQPGFGVWMLTEVDDSLTQTGAVNNFTTTIQPHQDLLNGENFTIQPNSWFYGFIDVPPGATSLTIIATNLTGTATPPLELFDKFGSEPTRTSYDESNLVNNATVPPPAVWGSVTNGPPLESGRYFVGIFNPSPTPQSGVVFATIVLPFVPAQTIYNSTDTPIPILDDAVTTDSIFVTNYAIISSLDVALAVQHPRISDLVFHLISPDGTRELLMENRGGTDPNGAGGIATVTTNVAMVSDFDTVAAGDYFVNQPVGGTGWIVAGNQVSVQTDPANAYGGKNNYLALASGTLFTNLTTVPGATYTLTFAYRGPGIVSWWRGENNANDSINNHNGTFLGDPRYANGLVNQAFQFTGNGSPRARVNIPDSTDFILTNELTMEGWAWVSNVVDPYVGYFIFRGDDRAGLDPYLIQLDYSTPGSKTLTFQIQQNNTVAGTSDLPYNISSLTNQWVHLAGTWNRQSGLMSLYVNGIPVVQTVTPVVPIGALDPNSNPGIGISGNQSLGYLGAWHGMLDEVSLYNRALSASEIQAIKNDGLIGNGQGGNGKFDPNEFVISPPLSLAEAQLKINNGATVTPTNFFGNNTTWQTMTVSFKATQSSTPLQIQGIEPGMLLDAISAVAVTTNYSYLVFTENTNLTTTPIKFAVPPFEPGPSTNIVVASGFDSATPNDYTNGTTFRDGTNVWGVVGNEVSVMNDPANADAGTSHFLTLAGGSITNVLPTLAGHTYVLSFRYRGPGIVGWWRGENNTSDSSGFNNYPTNTVNMTYSAGEVGQAFGFSGLSSMTAPPSSSLAVTNLTFEGWIYPTSTRYEPIIDYGGSNQESWIHFWINGVGLGQGPGSMYANMRPNNIQVSAPGGTISPNTWSHVALTYNMATLTEFLYHNGAPVGTTTAGTVDVPLTTNTPVNIGIRDPYSLDVYGGYNYAFQGFMDEISIYNRALSASEINAIYNNGINGKFDPGLPNPQSLAEAQVSVDGSAPATFVGDNNNWQTKTIIFMAKQNGTPLQITGMEPGMLLDSFALAQSAGDTYYLPEQSLDAYDGLNSHGTWTLEVQDDRVGATNPAPLLLNWQLRFNFVTLGTNIYPAVPLTLPQLPELIAVAGQLFTVTNAAFGGTPPYTYALTSSVPFAPFPTIDTNGVITWTPTTNQAPGVYTFTNIVTDTSLATATDIFQVLVVMTNGLPAFPGAEGPGGGAVGGRGGDVYHVINLNDGGPGSLRYGITNTSGNRTIVFDVGGTIVLQTNLVINDPYLTIAGQTAPGDGITLQGYATLVQNAHDDVLRFLRCRPGDVNSPAFQGDSFHFLGVTNSIADHISASWSIDDVLSTTYSTNISVQWSIIAQSLNHAAHYMDSGAPGFQANGFGSLIRYGSGAVGYHHDLYADNDSYNPRPGDNIQLDFINNVVCNWGISAGLNADDSANNPNGFTNFLNYLGNYFIAGSNTTANPNFAFQASVPNAADAQIYQGTNYIDNNAATNLLNGINTGWGMFNGTLTQLGAPTPLPGFPITVTNPPQAYEQVLAFAGNTVAGASASGTYLLRDSVDTNIVNGVRNKNGQIVDFVSSNRFSGAYLIANSEATYSGYANAGTYWQSQGVTNFVGVNPWPVLDSAPQPLDSDGDGMPDYWEITLAALGVTSMNPAVPNNNHPNPDGYTDLEHYINWLAAPHAITVSNTPVDVDLYAIVGRTGNWGFGVTNAINGTVTLTNGYIATFTPTNGFIGFASFDFNATNLVTSNYFGVTVSVFVSITNITYSSVLLSNAKSASSSATNTVPANSIFYYLVKVPTNALFATNRLLFANAPVNLLFSGVGFPTGTNIGDYTLLTGSTGGSSALSTTSVPTNIVQGGTYYLGVQNTGGTPVNFGVEVDFSLISAVSNVVIISGPTITATNMNGTNGFLLKWSGPTNYQYTIQWKTNLTSAFPWNTVSNPVINLVYIPPDGHYSWFDDGSLTGGWPPAKFYRVVADLLSGPITNSTPVTNVIVAGSIMPLTVTVPSSATAATNLLISATGPVNVYFNQAGPPTGNTNAGDVLMLSTATSGTFVLTGSSVPPLVPGANYYLGLQNPGASNVTFVFQVNFGFSSPSTNPPSISGITVTNINGTNAILLRWVAPTNYQFQVEWATNLAPAIAWHTISNVVLTWSGVVSPTNAAYGIFQYLDDGSLTGGWGPLKFYRLIEYPYSTPIAQTLTIINTAIIGGAVQFQWVAPTNYQYQVLWTTNLGLPLASWSILANPALGLSNGVYTFTDTNQTGPATSPKFFRLLEVP